jgi:hypothetical protein
MKGRSFTEDESASFSKKNKKTGERTEGAATHLAWLTNFAHSPGRHRFNFECVVYFLCRPPRAMQAKVADF